MLQLQVAQHRIGVHEALGGLHQGHGRIQQQADGAIEEVALGHEVGVEYGHQVAAPQGQAGVEVAGLGMQPLGPVVVAAAVGSGERCHLWQAPIVQYPDGAVWIVEAGAAQQAALQHG